MNTVVTDTVWERGRFDARQGPSKLLFGRMYEDASIELATFKPGGRVFCIASAGCTAMALAPCHEVIAVDINAVQLAYAERRFAGDGGIRGAAERLMDLGRTCMPLAGWWPSRLRAFLNLDDPRLQADYWARYLDTRRFRTAIDGMLSITSLRAVYASLFLDFLPPRLGEIMRARLQRCFATHPNRTNPYARALLLGELPDAAPPRQARDIRLVHADAAAFLESQPAASIDGFTLSNILDGAAAAYRDRLFSAVKRVAAANAAVVLRSFAEPKTALATNRAADDRAMLWGIVDVRPAAALS